MALLAFATNMLAILLLWIWYRHNQDKRAVEVAKKRFPNQNPRRMGMLSELWQIMYIRNNAPTIHAFESGQVSEENTNDPFESVLEFWIAFSKKYINFRSVPTKINGRWFWVEKEDYDPTLQIKQVKLSSKSELNSFLNSKLNEPFDKSLPFWESYFIRFEKESDETLSYVKLHHALGDGVLLSKAIQMEHNALFKGNNKSQRNSGQDTKIKQRKRPVTIQTLAARIWYLIKFLPFALKDMTSLLFIESAPLKSGVHCDFNTREREFKIAISKPLPLSVIKKVTKQYGGTVNDFVMTVFCHAVYKYLQQIGKPVDSGLYLRFFSIFDMRSLLLTNQESLDESLRDYGNGVGANENNVSTVPIALPCGHMSFVERFHVIHDLFYKLKAGPTPILSSLMLKMGHAVFGLRFVDYLLGQMIAKKCTFTLSNLMGPKEPIPAKEGKVCNVFNVTNPTFVPNACGIMSYCDNVTFVLNSTTEAIADPEQFMDCLHGVFESMSSFSLK